MRTRRSLFRLGIASAAAPLAAKAASADPLKTYYAFVLRGKTYQRLPDGKNHMETRGFIPLDAALRLATRYRGTETLAQGDVIVVCEAEGNGQWNFLAKGKHCAIEPKFA